MNSRDAILKALRGHRVASEPLPAIAGDWVRYDDPFLQFQAVLESVGGRCLRVAAADRIHQALAALPWFSEEARVVSFVPGVPASVAWNDVDDPHRLESVDWAVMPARLGVAENAAVWVTDEAVRHRAIYFIVQHLALVLPMDQIVHNMHEAYGHLSLGESSLGVFVSGPSKTADIEQSLVIGAHGPRSLTVICVDSGAP